MSECSTWSRCNVAIKGSSRFKITNANWVLYRTQLYVQTTHLTQYKILNSIHFQIKDYELSNTARIYLTKLKINKRNKRLSKHKGALFSGLHILIKTEVISWWYWLETFNCKIDSVVLWTMRVLNVAEKPSVAKEVSKILSNNNATSDASW